MDKSEDIKITVTMQGRCIHITCLRQNSISELKQLIKQKENIDPESYNLVINGRVLGPS